VCFLAMTGVWCAIATWLVRHPVFGPPIRRWASFTTSGADRPRSNGRGRIGQLPSSHDWAELICSRILIASTSIAKSEPPEAEIGVPVEIRLRHMANTAITDNPRIRFFTVFCQRRNSEMEKTN